MSSETSKLRLRLRLSVGALVAMGPGKADLLDGIRATGSIAAAGRGMGMSYKRAWQLVDVMNRCYEQPVVAAAVGGSRGGGASLTPFGADLLARYRRIEVACEKAAAKELVVLAKQLRRS